MALTHHGHIQDFSRCHSRLHMVSKVIASGSHTANLGRPLDILTISGSIPLSLIERCAAPPVKGIDEIKYGQHIGLACPSTSIAKDDHL